MKLFQEDVPSNWQDTFKRSLQVDLVAIPNGETYKTKNDEGREVTKWVTTDRICFGFQTDGGRGKGMQWIPEEHIPAALERLKFYAQNGVDEIIVSDEWLDPADAIDDTIGKVAVKDSNGKNTGAYDISFRVRLGKGSKSVRVPEKDFPLFVEMLHEVAGGIPEAIKALNAKIAADAAKGEAKKAQQLDDDKSDSKSQE